MSINTIRLPVLNPITLLSSKRKLVYYGRLRFQVHPSQMRVPRYDIHEIAQSDPEHLHG